jgi:magnesium-transporting ATPase (P-type)
MLLKPPGTVKKSMDRLHLVFGIVLFVVFLVTGRFMRWDFPDKEIIAPEFRILMRSRHIYILLSSLIHILLGVYLQIRAPAWRRNLQIFASVLLMGGSVLLVWAFVYETYVLRQYSEVSRFALYATLAGTVFHLFGGAKIER